MIEPVASGPLADGTGAPSWGGFGPRPTGTPSISRAPEDERAALAQQLRAWAGAKYKVHEGGLDG
ncbi:hypothetical protein [Streptacidiphilus rugosus]|uniref:hypothetical protein n=1 Tax=Streptacidiphilus rugosus TaxID=405783 RepID=UPI0005646346|nr:hypothetical protein [Streptacidiphilus rugosus]